MTPPSINLQAVVYSDIRLDDKVCLYILSQLNRYSKIHIVLSAINDFDGAYQDLVTFFDSLKHPLPFNEVFTVIKGANPFGKEQPQEKSFQPWQPKKEGDSLLPLVEYKHWLATLSSGQQVTSIEVFQICAVAADDLKLLFVAEQVEIRMYHLVHGWNSYQAPPTPATLEADGLQATKMKWLTSLNSDIKIKHPQALVIFTNKHYSFDPIDIYSGNHARYEDFKGIIPQQALDVAVDDGFYVWIYTGFDRILKENNIDFRVVPDASTLENPEDALASLLLEARMNETERSGSLREKFLNALNTGLELLEGKEGVVENLCSEDIEVINRIKTAGRVSLQTPLSIELCDAIHVLAVLRSLHHLGPGSIPTSGPFSKIRFEINDFGIGFEVLDSEECVDEGGDSGCHGLALMGVDAKPVKEQIRSFRW